MKYISLLTNYSELLTTYAVYDQDIGYVQERLIQLIFIICLLFEYKIQLSYNNRELHQIIYSLIMMPLY